ARAGRRGNRVHRGDRFPRDGDPRGRRTAPLGRGPGIAARRAGVALGVTGRHGTRRGARAEDGGRTRREEETMAITVDEKSLTHGVLSLVVTLVEVIQEALERQAVRRMEGGDLTVEELERLGDALLELDEAIEEIKADHGITESV